MDNKERFLSLCSNIKRDGIEGLIEWINSSDFFDAPASTRFHGSYSGGLCEHSLNVYDEMRRLLSAYPDIEVSDETVIITTLFHDLCKVNFYTVSERNVKNEYGEWIKVPYYAVENQGILVGHGYKSARLVNKYLSITDEEYMAIVHHMGYSSDDNIANVSEIFNKSQLALLLHIADTKATFIDENESLNRIKGEN